jgi:hypothetical protein
MPDYQQSKIYKIVSPNTDKIYIGSTTKQYLSSRMAHHVCAYKKWLNGEHHKLNSFDVLEFGDCKIILIEPFPCNTKEELEAREYHYIKENKELTTNTHMPSRTKKVYAIEHKAEIAEYQKKWNEENKEKLNKAKQKWADENRELINKRAREKRALAKANKSN